jgi:hypothetical protein|tara:strand:- start:755 stop:1003 length:249 start_codon:yes stop_codon:yes gene_type:complete
MNKIFWGLLFIVSFIYTTVTVVQMFGGILLLLFVGDEFKELISFFQTLSDSGFIGLMVLLWPILMIKLTLFLYKKYKSLETH